MRDLSVDGFPGPSDEAPPVILRALPDDFDQVQFRAISGIFMFFILQAAAIFVALFMKHPFAYYIACVIPIIYIIIIGPGTFRGGSDVDLERLREQLRQRWAHYDELAAYMQRYWYALRYAMSAVVRQNNCALLSLMSFAMGLYYIFGTRAYVPSVVLFGSGVVLHLMAIRVNRPLGIFCDPKFRNSFDDRLRTEWRLAATSLVAFSEFFPESANHKFLADKVLGDDVGAGVVGNWRLK